LRRTSDEAPAEQPLLELKNVCVSYGNVVALKDVSLGLKSGRIHSVVGEHGAGKSSLCHLVSGFTRAKSGQVAWRGAPCRSLSSEAARRLGIELVTQSNHMFDDLSVAVNLFLSPGGRRNLSLVTNRETVQRARRFLEGYGFSLDPARPLRDLYLPDRVLVDILRHIAVRPELLVLDEALEKLTAEYLDRMMEIFLELKREGTGILFATHNIDSIYRIADTVTILRNGSVLITDSVQNIEKINLMRLAYTQVEREPEMGDTSEEFYQLLKYNAAILELLPVILVVTDQKNRIKLLNRSALEYFSRKGRLQINRHIRSLFLPENRGVYALIRESLSGTSAESFSHLSLSKGRSTRTINLKTFPILDGAFKIGSMIIIDDISEQEKLKDQILLSERLASVGLLAAGVAHEINNPLEVMSNYADQLKTRVASAEGARILTDLEGEIDSIKQIIGQLLTFSSNAVTEVEVFDLNTLLDTLLRLVTINAKSRGVSISCHGLATPLPIRASRNEIKQVLLNLLKNGLEAMPGGGKLEITTREVTKRGNAFVQVLFRDTGVGIREKDIDDVFLPFFTTKLGKAEHMGLGLSVSYGIVTKYGGIIKARNRSTQGCEFEVLLPALDTRVLALDDRDLTSLGFPVE
jgi:signal transduction histidine kinase